MQHQVIEFYRQNLQLARETGNRRDEMSALASLGRAYEALEERDKAIEFYELAVKIAADLGDGRAERQTLKHLNEARNPEAAKTAKASSSKKAARKRPGNSAKARRKSSKKHPTDKTLPSMTDQQSSTQTGREE